MTGIAPAVSPLLDLGSSQMNPVLSPSQIARIRAAGAIRKVEAGETLISAGDNLVPFFIVLEGRVEIIQRSVKSEVLIAVHGPGQFTGEVNMLSGRRSLVGMRVAEAGELIELDRPSLLALVQKDGELGEVVMRAFILRRVDLIAQG